MKKEIVFTNIQLDEVNLSTATIKKGAELSKVTPKLDAIIAKAAKEAEPQFAPMQQATGSLDGVNAPKEERNLSDSYQLILQSLDSHLKQKLNLGLNSDQDQNLRNDIKSLFVNTQTISPKINLVLKEYKATSRTSITIDASELATKYQLSVQHRTLLFRRIEAIVNQLNQLKSTIKFVFVQPKPKPKKEKKQSQQPTNANGNVVPTDEQVHNKLDEFDATQEDHQFMELILNEYKALFPKKDLIPFILSAISYTANIVSLGAAAPTGGASLAGLAVGRVADLLKAAYYFNQAGNLKNRAKGVAALFSAIPIFGQAKKVVDIIKLIKDSAEIKKQVSDYLKGFVFKYMVQWGIVTPNAESIAMKIINFILRGGEQTDKLIDLLDYEISRRKQIKKNITENIRRQIRSSYNQPRKRIPQKKQVLSEAQIHRWQVLANIKK